MIAAPPNLAFWLLALVMLTSAFLVVSLRNIFHCALFLVLCLFSVAGLFVMLDAEFLAVAQVLIYVGAVAILLIFSIMLTSNLTSRKIKQSSENSLVAFSVCFAFCMGSIGLIATTEIWQLSDKALPVPNTLWLGKYLMTEFMLPFEVVSVLLLAALIGAVVLARQENA